MLPGTLKNKWGDPTDLRLDRTSILQGKGKGKGSEGRTRGMKWNGCGCYSYLIQSDSFLFFLLATTNASMD